MNKEALKTLVPPAVMRPIVRFRKYTYEIRRRRKACADFKIERKSRDKDFYSLNAFDYYRCIFVHVPKAAGLSVCQSLFHSLGPGHWNIRGYQRQYSERTFNAYFKFCIVRNPWDRLYSAYKFLKAGGMNEYDQKFSQRELSSIQSFEVFVLDWLSDERLHSHIHFVPQIDFLMAKDGSIPIDFIGRFENLQNDYDFICKKIGVNEPLLHNNISKGPDFRTVYSPEMVDRVQHLYSKDAYKLDYFFE